MLPNAEEFSVYDPRLVRHHRVQWLVLDGDGLRRKPGADGRRCAAQATGGGHRHGLILEGKDFAVISDILGDEDHLGDMDFKVAGTSDGVTALQMDIKVAGITEEIMRTALAQAKEGRAHILGEMAKALDHTREELSAHAPRIETMQIPKDKIREVIGTGGKVIREIVATTGAKVDIDDEGLIKNSSSDLSQIEAARSGSTASSPSRSRARSTPARSPASSISARS